MLQDSLVEQFSQYFLMIHAKSPSLLKKAFHLRYQVFCQEFKFEHEEDCPHQLESDALDLHAEHFLIQHKDSQQMAGYIRLLTPHPGYSLPFEQFIDPIFAFNKNDSYLEASRLLVAPQFRRRRDDPNTPSALANKMDIQKSIPRHFPLIALSLIFISSAYCNFNHISHLFGMMEPKLAFSLNGFGIHLNQVGALANYHGQRAPFLHLPHSLYTTLPSNLLNLYEYISQNIQLSESLLEAS